MVFNSKDDVFAIECRNKIFNDIDDIGKDWLIGSLINNKSQQRRMKIFGQFNIGIQVFCGETSRAKFKPDTFFYDILFKSLFSRRVKLVDGQVIANLNAQEPVQFCDLQEVLLCKWI